MKLDLGCETVMLVRYSETKWSISSRDIRHAHEELFVGIAGEFWLST